MLTEDCALRLQQLNSVCFGYQSRDQSNAMHIRTRIVHFRDTLADAPDAAFEYLSDAILSVEQGTIRRLEAAESAFDKGLDATGVIDMRHLLTLPGFIDSHVHASQQNIIAAFGEQLMDWLNAYTFPEETRFAELDYAEQETERFMEALLAHGTTTALIFCTSFKHSVSLLFEQALKRNMRVIAGKVLMDRNAPQALLDKSHGIADTQALIERYHGKKRLGYAITPRFAGTSTREQLCAAGDLAEQYPDVWIQTHLSENKAEVAWTNGLFTEAKDYLDIYQRAGLLKNERSVFAHGIHLSDDELKRLAASKSSIAFCPSSNLFLGSGLLDLQRLRHFGVQYSIASDVGAGTSLCQFRSMADAYKVCQMTGYTLSAREAYYRTTLGAAKALGLSDYIGNLSPGKEADFVMINPARNTHIANRIEHVNSIDEELFVYMTMGDERLIEQTYIAGVPMYSNPQQLPPKGVLTRS